MTLEFVTALLSIISSVLPALTGDASKIGSIITLLENIVEAGAELWGDLKPTITNIIASLRSTDGITPAQLDALDTIEAKIDAQLDQDLSDFDAQDAGQ